MSNRVEKGSSLLKKTLSRILLEDINDPRLEGVLVTISKINLSSDLKYAKVFLSIYNAKNSLEVLEVIKNAKGFIRKEVARKIKFRVLPDFDFVIDDSEDYSEKINSILKNIGEEENQ